MAKFKVLIARTFLTEIEVDAPSAAAARRQVTEYGPDIATQDYPASDVGGFATIKAVVAAAPGGEA